MQTVAEIWSRLTFTRQKQQMFLEDLCSLIEDGVPVSSAIDTICQISEGVNKRVAEHIGLYLAQGQLLADGMQGWFTPAIVEIIRAGESGGNLEETLRAALNTFSEQTSAISALFSSLVYPIVVIIFALFIVVFIKDSVLDKFAEIKPVSIWPELGRNLYQFGMLVQDWWWLLAIAIALIIFLVARLLQTLTGSMRRLIDQMPFLSLYRELSAARFMETLGLLITNGVALKKALTVMHNQSSAYLSWHLSQMEQRLSSGQENIADVLNTDLINRNDLLRLKVVTKGKNFEQALISLGRQAHRRNTKTITVMGRFLSFILLLLAAFIAISIIMGIYSIGSVLAQ